MIKPSAINPSAGFDGFGYSFAEYYPYGDQTDAAGNTIYLNNVDNKAYNGM